MKKKLFLVLCILYLFTMIALAACSLSARLEKLNASDSNSSYIDQLQAAVTFQDILVFAHSTQNNGEKDYIELGLKDLMSEKVLEFFFSEANKIGGTYYYKEYFIPGTFGASKFGEKSEDARMIFVDKEGKSVYIAPAYILNGNDPSTLLLLDSAIQYKYTATVGKCTDRTWGKNSLIDYYDRMEVTLIGTNNTEIDLSFTEDGSIVEISNRFPDMGENYEWVRCYLSNEYEAEQNAQKEYNEMIK